MTRWHSVQVKSDLSCFLSQAKVCVLRHQGSHRGKAHTPSTDKLLLQDFEEISLPLPWLEHIALVGECDG